MNNVCDLVLVFMVTVSPCKEEQREVYASYKNAEKIADDPKNGRFVGFSAVRQFPCNKGPHKDDR